MRSLAREVSRPLHAGRRGVSDRMFVKLEMGDVAPPEGPVAVPDDVGCARRKASAMGRGRRHAPGPEWLGRPPDGASVVMGFPGAGPADRWRWGEPPIKAPLGRAATSPGPAPDVRGRAPRRFFGQGQGWRGRALGGSGSLIAGVELHGRSPKRSASLDHADAETKPSRKAPHITASRPRPTSLRVGSWHVGRVQISGSGVLPFRPASGPGPSFQRSAREPSRTPHGSYNADGAPEHSRGAPRGVSSSPLTCGCRGC